MTTIYVRECFAYVIFWVLWCHILYLSFSHLSLFLYVVWGCVLTSLIYMRLSNFSNTTCWRDCLFSSVYCCLLCRRFIDCRCVGLFVFSSIDLYVCFCASTMLFWYYSFVVKSKVWETYASSFVLFPQDCFGNLGFKWTILPNRYFL